VRKVTKIVGRHAWVHGSATGISMGQLTVADPPAPTPAGALRPASEKTAAEGQGETSAPDISVLLVGNSLQITANVDAAGLVKLKDVLNKYEEILKLLQ
jgi:hypothetical protein